MKIIHIASELAPIAKVGGLGDVVYGLAKQQKKEGDTVKIILPHYKAIDASLLAHYKEKENYCTAEYEKLPLVLLGSYDQIYGGNETERFASFCKQALGHIDEDAIVHLHDWPVAMLAPLLKNKVVLSIHNFHHQGTCSPDQVKDLNLPLNQIQCPKTPNCINLLKCGLLYSDAIIAVSPRYAQEILTPAEGDGLQNVLAEHKHKLFGVLNGIDTDYWNPASDPFLMYSFDTTNYKVGKESNRSHLYHELKMERSTSPLVCVITRLVPQKGLDMIERALVYTLENHANFMLLGSSSDLHIQNHFQLLAKKHAGPNLHCHFTFDEKLAHMVYAASDMIVIPSIFEPCGLTQMIAMRYGTVPIVRKTGGLADTVTDTLNGFTFADPTTDACQSALTRAFETYRTKHTEWTALIEQGMSAHYGWNQSALEYRKIYTQLNSKE